MSDLSIRLKNLREAHSLSKAEMARKIGISGGAYSNWEYGNREPSIDTLKKIASIFNIPSSELIKFGTQEAFALNNVSVTKKDETHFSYKAQVISDSFNAELDCYLELLPIISHISSNPALAINIKIKDIKKNDREFNLYDLEPIFLQLVAYSAIEQIPYSLKDDQESIPIFFSKNKDSKFDGIFYLE
ncbi:helix-turn-helix transcriptional regulator [Enterococcus canintestini]|uniref:helix-turn-helix domain-containing protein n=1 Tax=Enterococcus canintestini TaxID=317010 RepID=UPI00288E6BE5|nr:helix-turn-helix transcriptional regulator [Enterococcus canintestini]MDT2738877.1 helix-turn-helix transcriptional regulator [Enterococcus canintestini]